MRRINPSMRSVNQLIYRWIDQLSSTRCCRHEVKRKLPAQWRREDEFKQGVEFTSMEQYKGYVTRGMYAPILAWWLQWFSAEQLLLINFDDLRDDPVGVVQRIV